MSRKLLVVDDNQGCCDLYKMRFEIAGYDVKVVFSAEEAIELLKDYHPDAILLDLMLPKMQGDELLKILKSDSKTNKIKIAILTALNLAPEKEREVCDKADDCIFKIDITPKDLVKRVEAMLKDK
jgi:DNA-binding response OmpR family regulator